MTQLNRVQSDEVAFDRLAACRYPDIARRKSGRRICARLLAVMVAVLFSAASGVISTPLRADKVVLVDQITDLGAAGTSRMFRFVPNLIGLEIGEQLLIRNSTGGHTVHTIPEIWPSGEPFVKISHAKIAQISFKREGYYGFTCRRHGTYGMVMLVVVGRPGATNPGREQSIEELATRFRGPKRPERPSSPLSRSTAHPRYTNTRTLKRDPRRVIACVFRSNFSVPRQEADTGVFSWPQRPEGLLGRPVSQ